MGKCVHCALRLHSKKFCSGRPLRPGLHRKERTVCAYTARFHVETRVFYPTISQRSCHIQRCFCIQPVALHSMFNIKEFHASFSTLYFIISKCILYAKRAYRVRLRPQEYALKHGCFITRYCSDPAMYRTVTETKI